MCANSEGSGETAWMRRLALAFAGRLCDGTISSCAGSYVFDRRAWANSVDPDLSESSLISINKLVISSASF